MKRKINRVGTNTLTVSLPSGWVKKAGVKVGDELETSLFNNEICFSLGPKNNDDKEITLNIDDLDDYLLFRHLETLYITNYNKIILTYSKSEIPFHKGIKTKNLKTIVTWHVSRLIGMEIVSQTKNMTELHCFISGDEKDLDKIGKRIYYLFKDMADELLISLRNNTNDFHDNRYEYHDAIIKFIIYYLRILDQSSRSNYEKQLLFTLYMIVDKMIDKFRHISEMVEEYGATKKVIDSLEEIFNLIYEQFTALHKGKITKELVHKRYALVNKVNNSKWKHEEFAVISEAKPLLDTLNDFSRAIIVRRI